MARVPFSLLGLVSLTLSFHSIAGMKIYTSTISAGEESHNSGLELAFPNATTHPYTSRSLSVCLRLDISVVGSTFTPKSRLVTVAHPPRPEGLRDSIEVYFLQHYK